MSSGNTNNDSEPEIHEFVLEEALSDQVVDGMHRGNDENLSMLISQDHVQSSVVESNQDDIVYVSNGDMNMVMRDVSFVEDRGSEVTVVTDRGWSQDGDMNEYPICMVCADRGSGYHYSVYSCEGCKGFFKRTVQRNLVYMCKDQQSCEINKVTRNNCQYCRYMKCLLVGMRKEAVREDRMPGGKCRPKQARFSDSPSRQCDAQPTNTVYIRPEPYDPVLLEALVNAKPDLIPVIDPPIVDVAAMDVGELMQHGYTELRYIIEWARKVPGFSDLQLEDQMSALKASFMELNILRLAHRSLDHLGYVQIADGLTISEEQAEKLGWGAELVACTVEFVNRLVDMQYDRTEFAILNAIILTFSDVPGLLDKEAVQSLQRVFLGCLRQYSLSKYPSQPCRYSKLLLRLPALRTYSMRAAERFLNLALDNTIKLNALVVEIMS